MGTESLPRISNRIKKKTSKAKATHFLNELDESEWLSDNETNFLEDNTLADAMAASDTKVYFQNYLLFIGMLEIADENIRPTLYIRS